MIIILNRAVFKVYVSEMTTKPDCTTNISRTFPRSVRSLETLRGTPVDGPISRFIVAAQSKSF